METIVGYDETVSTAEGAAAVIDHAYETHLKSSGAPTTYHDHPPWGPSIAALCCHKLQEHIPQTYTSQPRECLRQDVRQLLCRHHVLW